MQDKWVKATLAAPNPMKLACLIEDRIRDPKKHGPYYWGHDSDSPADIIIALLAKSKEMEKKLPSSVGLILYNLIYEGKKMDASDLRHLFYLIREADLRDCDKLLKNWLDQQHDSITSEEKTKRETYASALIAYSRIQRRDEEAEQFWKSLWEHGISYWWPIAFMGLKNQNPLAACDELSLFILRMSKIDNAKSILPVMWHDESTRPYFLASLRQGLWRQTGWASLTINTVYGKLKEFDKPRFLEAMGMRESIKAISNTHDPEEI